MYPITTKAVIGRDENKLIGAWVCSGGMMQADVIAKRIEMLISGYLERVATDDSGWESLYKDPEDGRLWELTYPQGDMHGGGPPLLKCIPLATAQAKYVFDASYTSP